MTCRSKDDGTASVPVAECEEITMERRQAKQDMEGGGTLCGRVAWSRCGYGYFRVVVVVVVGEKKERGEGWAG